MKVVILAGGLGTRISEESHLKPKPMIEIGGKPILWHIMKYFSHYGHNEFIICGGYKDYKIKEYFANYYLHTSDIMFDFEQSATMSLNNKSENWKVTCINTGLITMTGGRLLAVKDYIGDEPFFLTYGDGVSNVDLDKLLDHHKNSKSIVSLTAIQPGGRFGVLEIDDNLKINSFVEKSKEDGGWINGGFMVCSNEVFDYLLDSNTVFEKEPLETIATNGKLSAYKHEGFWQCMDTLRDRDLLEKLILDGVAPWIVW